MEPAPSGNPGSSLHNSRYVSSLPFPTPSSKDIPMPMYRTPRRNRILVRKHLNLDIETRLVGREQIKASATIPEEDSFPLHWPLSHKHVLDFRQSSEMTCQTLHLMSIATHTHPVPQSGTVPISNDRN